MSTDQDHHSEAPIDDAEVSLLLEKILLWLNDEGIGYCVERNFEGYPNRLTGDLDILVSDWELARASSGILALARNCGWCCYHNHTWGKSSYLGLSNDLYPARFALTVELFAGARWRGLPYLPSLDAVEHRKKSGITWGPRPAHQAIITSIHHLLYNGEVPAKYRDEVHNLLANDSDMAISELTKSFGRKSAHYITDAVMQKEWDSLESIVASLKRKLVYNRLLRSPVETLFTLINGFRSKWQIPEGVIVQFQHNELADHDSISDEMLFLADKWHLFLPPIRKIFRLDKGEEIHTSSGKVRAIIEAGGVVVINGGGDFEINVLLQFPVYKVTRSAEEFRLSACNTGSGDGVLLLSETYTTEIGMAARIWNSILADRYCRVEKLSSDNA